MFYCIIAQIYTIGYFLRSAIAPITDVLEEEFHATTSQIGLCSSLLFIGYFTMQIPSGMLLQVYNPEFVSMCCSLLMGLCSALFVLSPNIEMATASQFFAGIAQSAVAISVISVSAKRLGPEMVTLGYGVVKLYCYLSLILMQYLQALLYETYSVWRPIFYFCSGSCFVLGIISFFALTIESNLGRSTATDCDSNDHEISMQKLRDESYSQNTPLIDSDSSTTSNCHCFPLRNPLKSDKKQSVLVSLKLSVQNRMNYVFALYMFLMAFILYGFYGLWLISYLMLKFGFQRSAATLISSSFYSTTAVNGTVFGYLSKRFERRKLFIILGPALSACSLLVIYAPDSTPMVLILCSSIIAGIGFGLLLQTVFSPSFFNMA